MKKKLRAEALAKRNAISPEEREGKSSKAAAYLLQSEAFRNAKKVFTFVNMGTEIETRKIMPISAAVCSLPHSCWSWACPW